MHTSNSESSNPSEVVQAIQLGWSHHQAGRLEAAEGVYRQVLEQDPSNAVALNLLGVLAFDVGNLEIAEELFLEAIEADSSNAQYYSNLGLVFNRSGRIDEAIKLYMQALSLQPELVEGLANLGGALLDRGRLDEALVHLQKAISLQPFNTQTWGQMGNVLMAGGKHDEAVECYKKALQIAPEAAELHNNFGCVLKNMGKLDQAIDEFHHAADLDPGYVAAYANLGGALRERGQTDAAIGQLTEAITINPGLSEVHSLLASAFLYLPSFEERAAEEHFRWSEVHAKPFYGSIPEHANVRDVSRKLKIGYVSNDFRFHATSFFIEPIFEAYDRSQFEIICYSNATNTDSVTRRLMALVDAWRDIAGLPDEAVYEMVREDQVDILVDLMGHTNRNRLLVFARKPSPIQVTWIGYPYTTALRTMDYWIADQIAADPCLKGSQPHSEELVLLPDFFMCFKPTPDSPSVNDLPAIQAGHITFGSFNANVKVNSEVIELWSKILNSISDSRLIMLTVPEGEAQQIVHAQFARHGITPDRVELVPRLTHEEFLLLHRRVDIALDPFPYNGTTTSLHGLWMGVPFISLLGNTFAARVGASILENLGLSEFIAESPDAYIEIAIKNASDLNKLRALRTQLRERMQGSPLVDASRFTQNLENAYHHMWTEYCSGQASTKV